MESDNFAMLSLCHLVYSLITKRFSRKGAPNDSHKSEDRERFPKKKVHFFRSHLSSLPLSSFSLSHVETPHCRFGSRLHGSVGWAQSSGDSWPTRQEVDGPGPSNGCEACDRALAERETRWFRDEKFSPRFRICLSSPLRTSERAGARGAPVIISHSRRMFLRFR